MPVLEFLLPYAVPITLLLFSMSLWTFYINGTRDLQSDLPLPPGTVGLPFVGETFFMLFRVRLKSILNENSLS